MATKSETFRNIYYSDSNAFTVSEEKVSLKRYKDDLLFYTSFDSTLNATYYAGNQTPTVVGTNDLENFGVFAQHVNVTGSISYGSENFSALLNEGSVKFRLRTGFNNGDCYQDTKSTASTIVDGTYYFDLYINNNLVKNCSVDLVSTDTVATTIIVKLETALTGTVAAVSDMTGKIRFYLETAGDIIEIRDPVSGFSFTSLFGGMNKYIIPNGPSVNTSFLTFTNGINNNNKIEITHTTTSHIIVKMYNYLGALVVEKDFGIFSNVNTTFYAFELTWTDSSLFLFLDGKLIGVEPYELVRSSVNTKLVLSGSPTNIYKIDELVVYKVPQNFKNYIVETAALTPYPTDTPYVDIEFGTGFKEEEVKDLNVVCSSGCHFSVKIGATWYYYLSGDWRSGDGTFSQSVTASVIETKFQDLYFNEEASLIIRVFFESDGTTDCWIDNIDIITESGDEKSAVITGTIAITAVDLSVNNKVKITTDQGTLEVDVSVGAANPSAVTLEEIKSAINAAAVPGLDIAKDDGFGHLVLQTATKGADAFISISEATADDCLDIIWGYEATDLGEDAGVVNVVDYSPIFDFVRHNLGAPIVPVELTDGQLETCLSEAVYEVNRWRNFNESIHYMTLTGDGRSGYDVPSIIGGSDFIIDVIVKPRMPFGYFSASGEMASNIYIQYLFHKYGRPTEPGFLTDYSLFLSFEKDMNLILGTEPRWEIVGGKMFLYPIPPSSGLQVGIKYRATLTIDEILTNQHIREYVLAKAKIILGTIRSTFGSSIPGGGEMIQLNGADLISQGKEELAALKEKMKSQSEPLLIMFG